MTSIGLSSGRASSSTPSAWAVRVWRPVCTSGFCWSAILKGSIPSAGGGFAGPARPSGAGVARGAARSLDDLAPTASHRSRNPSSGVCVGPGVPRRGEAAERHDARSGRYDPGSECGPADHRPTRHRRGLSGVPDRIGEGVGHRDAHAGGPRPDRSQATEEGVKRRLDAFPPTSRSRTVVVGGGGASPRRATPSTRIADGSADHAGFVCYVGAASTSNARSHTRTIPAGCAAPISAVTSTF